uniref:Metalloendopeptidase n=1 Tax=Timema shepardi TaxID=629360 RepID=A0A7R9FYT2_TIMSH|nr:unnamed protein product [Timema shepardi]
MASLVLTDSFEKLSDQIMYPYAEPYDLQKHPEPTDAVELANFSLWPNATLYYQMGLEFDTDQAKKIREAMDDIQERSCVRFLPRSGDTLTYVQLQNMGDKCASHVGYTPRIGPIDLYLSSPRCLKRGSIQHELFHSLGFWHEHNRSDRNKFVTIIWGNIKKGREHDFRSRPQMRNRSKRLPYDYGSVMHYRAKAFSKNRRIPTIVPRDPHALYKIGQRKRYSEIDLAKLNRMYNCGPEYYSGTDIDAKKKDAGSTISNKTMGNAASSSTTTPLPIVSVKFVWSRRRSLPELVLARLSVPSVDTRTVLVPASEPSDIVTRRKERRVNVFNTDSRCPSRTLWRPVDGNLGLAAASPPPH